MKIFIYFLLSLHVSFGIPTETGGNEADADPKVIADPPVDNEEPSASAGGSKTRSANSTGAANTTAGGASSTGNGEPQLLFNPAAVALIEQAKTKLNARIEITLKDTVVTAINSALTSTPDSLSLSAKKRDSLLVNSADNKKNNNQQKSAKHFGKTVEMETPEQLEHSKLIDEGATAPRTIDDVVEKSDNQQRSSRKRNLDNNKRRNQSSKRPGIERENEPSNAAMVGVNEIAVAEVSFLKRKGPPNRGTVTISSVIGPINVMLTSNSAEIPVASFSISAPIVILVGVINGPVKLMDISAKQLKTIDLKVNDALSSQAGTIMDEIKNQISSANFDQLLKDALGASLNDENIMSAFVDALGVSSQSSVKSFKRH